MTKNIYKSKNPILSIIGSIFANVALAIVITIVFAFASGYQVLNIITGSMTPTMPIGTVVVIKKVDINQVEVGDVITFKMGEANVTHRVVEKLNNGSNTVLYTQGDAKENEGSRETVRASNFVGVVIFHVKGLGHALDFIKENIIMITVAVVLALFIITYS